MPARCPSPLLRLVAIAAFLSAACVSHDDAGAVAGTEGSAGLTLDVSGVRQDLVIGGPPGELRVSFLDSETDCTLSLVAAEPRVGDITSAAEERRVRLDVRISTRDAPALLEGKVAKVTARGGLVFSSEGSVEVRHNRGRAIEDRWWSVGGGTITVSPLQAAIGSEVTLDLAAIVLQPHDDEGKALLSGRVAAKLGALTVLVKPGGCPAGAPGRSR